MSTARLTPGVRSFAATGVASSAGQDALPPSTRPAPDQSGTAPSLPLARALLMEPHFVLRRTIAEVSRDLGLVAFDETTNLVGAQAVLVSAPPVQAAVLDAADAGGVLTLLRRLRQGDFASHAQLPVILLLPAEVRELDPTLAELGAVRAVRRPFKVADLLEAMRFMGFGRR